MWFHGCFCSRFNSCECIVCPVCYARTDQFSNKRYLGFLWNDRESERLRNRCRLTPIQKKAKREIKSTTRNHSTHEFRLKSVESEKCRPKGQIAPKVQLNVKYIDVQTDSIEHDKNNIVFVILAIATPHHRLALTCRQRSYVCVCVHKCVMWQFSIHLFYTQRLRCAWQFNGQ